MAYYKTSYVHLPFLCAWECIYCAKKNIGKGGLPVKGEMVRYYPGFSWQQKEREQAATEKSLQGVEEKFQPTGNAFVTRVNACKKYHPALASVQPVCSGCGKKQPWQKSNNISKAMGYVLTAGILLPIIGGAIAGAYLPFEINQDVCIAIGCGFTILSFLILMLYPGYRRIVSTWSMKKNGNDACYPQVEMVQIKPKEEPHWVCRQCGAQNPLDREGCTRCGERRR